jgi:hypothetical protein
MSGIENWFLSTPLDTLAMRRLSPSRNWYVIIIARSMTVPMIIDVLSGMFMDGRRVKFYINKNISAMYTNSQTVRNLTNHRSIVHKALHVPSLYIYILYHWSIDYAYNLIPCSIVGASIIVIHVTELFSWIWCTASADCATISKHFTSCVSVCACTCLYLLKQSSDSN